MFMAPGETPQWLSRKARVPLERPVRNLFDIARYVDAPFQKAAIGTPYTYRIGSIDHPQKVSESTHGSNSAPH